LKNDRHEDVLFQYSNNANNNDNNNNIAGSKKKNIINSKKNFKQIVIKKFCYHNIIKRSKGDLKLHKNIAIILNKDNNKKWKKRKDKRYIYVYRSVL